MTYTMMLGVLALTLINIIACFKATEGRNIPPWEDR